MSVTDSGTESGEQKTTRKTRRPAEAKISAQAANEGDGQQSEATEALLRAAEHNLIAQSDIGHAYSRRLASASIKLNSEISLVQAAVYGRLQKAQENVSEAARGACVDNDLRAAYERARQEYFEAWWAYQLGTEFRESCCEAYRAYQEVTDEAAEDAQREAREAQKAYVDELKSILDGLGGDDLASVSLASAQLATAAAGLQ